MHIPDGYLSPATAGTLYAVSLPFWYLAVARVRRVLTQRTVPVLALFAAFIFVLMMFNIPLPGGTTGHAVGGTLLAIVLGPWAAVLGISVVLGIQALFFGDGGLITFGANCFNMAIVLPLVGYFVYKVIASNSEAASPRRLLGAVAGSYLGIVASSLFAGIELGLQPVLFHAVDGTPLYAPYGLNVALPVMLTGHLLVAGPVEAIVTGGIFAYLQKSHSSLISSAATTQKSSRVWLLWGALALAALATPLGLLASGTAWGEWGVEKLQTMGLGFIPQGIQKFSGWWPAPLPGYGFPRMGAAVGYILSALVGMALVAFLLWLLGRWLGRIHPHPGLLPSREKERKEKEHKAGISGEGFLTHNISRLTQALESVVSTENICRLPGLLQGLDPRVKIATFVLFIVVVGLAANLWVLAAVLVLITISVLLSAVSLGFFIRRGLLFIPIFTAVIAIPALFITPGDPWLVLAGKTIITQQGAHTAALLVLRVVDSLSIGVLLILTTPWNSFLAALRWFRLPSIVVDVLGMTYRYIFVLLHTANSMFLARRSRTLGSFSGSENRRWLARATVAVLNKSQHLSEEVYLAMLSRGYQGEIYTLNDFAIKRRDFVWIVCAVILATGSLALGFRF